MFWGLLLSVLVALFAYWTSFTYPFSDPKIILITAGVVAAWFWRGGKAHNRSLAIAATVYLLCMIPSLIKTKCLAMSLFGVVGVYSGSVLASLLCAGGLVLADRLKDRQKEIIRKTILSAGVMIAVILVAQIMKHDPFRWYSHGGKPPGIHGSSIDSAALMVTLLCTSFNPLYIAGAWATGCKAAWLGCAVAVVPVKFRLWAFMAVTICGITYAMCNSYAGDRLRADMWSWAAKSASIIGTGPATFIMDYNPRGPHEYAGHAHNSILDTAATKGLFGLLGLFALLVAPRMAGLWTVAMFQPISFEIVFIACILVAIRKRDDPIWTR